MAGNDGEFRYAVGAEVGYCLAGATQERRGTVVEVDEHFVTVRDAQARNEVRLGPADSIRLVQTGLNDGVPLKGQARGMQTTAPRGGTKERLCKRCQHPFAAENAQQKNCPACKAALKLEYQRAWRAKRGIVGKAKTCDDCGAEYQASSNAQHYCAACGETRRKAKYSAYKARVAGVAKDAPRGKPVAARTTPVAARTTTACKPVAARAKSASPTAAAQDNPRGNGMVIVPRPLEPTHAPSTANLDPYERAITATMSAELQGIAAQIVALAGKLERLEAALKGLL